MDEQENLSALHAWFLSPQGRDVARAFSAEIESAQLSLKGQRLLQLGCCAGNPWWIHMNYVDKWVLGTVDGHHLVGTVDTLPFERDSIDCIIAPLSLEISKRGQHLLDELDRVLKPMGYLIFMGINPWSFWGASLRWGRLSCFAQISSQFSSSLSVMHAMLNRGYRQSWLSSFYYLPPVGSEYWLEKLEFLNQMSKMVWPYPAGFYCLIMQKHNPCMMMTPKSLPTGNFRLVGV